MSARTTLVTGGSSAIGRSVALGFAREGATVAVGTRNRERGENTVRAVKESGGNAFVVEFDARDPREVEQAVRSVTDRCGRLDCAVNVVGGALGATAPITDLTTDQWNEVVAVNLTATWLCLRHELRQMRESGVGAVVNTIAALGLTAVPNLSAYVASKHAVVGLTKAAALEAADYGVRVNGVAPGMTVRNEPAEAGRTREAAAKAKVPLSRIAQAEEVAAAVLWLCSDAASYVTGHILSVDGGWTVGI